MQDPTTMVEERPMVSPASPSEPQENIDDLLDMEKHKLSVVRQKRSTAFERWLKYLGFPLGIAVFSVLYFMPTPEGLTANGQAVIAAFALALIWWIAEPVPTYVTSLCLMILLVFLDGWDVKNVLGVLGFDVIWLNVLAFILSSVLIKTNLAKRMSLRLITKFGHNAWQILLAFLALQLVLASLIPATAARAVMTLPIMMVVGAVYGSTSQSPNRFGKNLFLQNLLGINIFSSGFMTGSTANLIAVAFISNMAGVKVYYTDWMFANLPIAVLAMLIAWVLGPGLLFRIPAEKRKPQIKGGLNALKEQLERMGPPSRAEIRGAFIFSVVVFLWITDRSHMQWFGFEIDPVMAAMVGAVLALLPKVGLIKWNEADIPWHLMIFSAGAYAGGLALNDTGAATWVVQNIFTALHFDASVDFWTVYVIVIALMMYSHLVFTSKTMRTIIMIPFIIALAQQLGFHPLALALPAAFTIDWVVGLPISAKPNVILFTTGQYSVLDNIKYGVVVATIGVVLYVIAGFTWFRFLGITPAL